MSGKNEGLNRRVFINRGLAASGGLVALSHVWAFPAWADEDFEGEVTRMGRLKFDPESKRVAGSWLDVKVTTVERDFGKGPTNVSDAKDRIMVKVKESGGRYGKWIEVSKGQRDAKLDPRIDARGGRIAVTWCAMDHETRQWKVWLAYSADGTKFTDPMEVIGGNRPALHPSIALDPVSGTAWIAYEDWADGSVRLISFDGKNFSDPLTLSESGMNYRPVVIVTAADGKNRGAVAVAWDAYRNEQYDIYLRLIGRDGSPGPELRATQSPLWDCGVDLAEDHDGNLWIVWTRATNELSQTNALREVRTRFWNGERWLWPNQPEDVPEDNNGRLSAYSVNWHPKLIVDSLNRVHVFWRDGTAPVPPIIGRIRYRTYENDRWSETGHLKVNTGKNAIHMIWDFSAAVTDDLRIECVWDSQYVKRMGFISKVSHARSGAVTPREMKRCTAQGHDAAEVMREGWPKHKKFDRRTADINGKPHMLLYGDTHTHSWSSDGADPSDFYYHFARDYAGLDFFALSDHDFTVTYTPGLEALVSFQPEHFNREDFICFQAFEFSSQHKGHRVVVFERGYKPTFSMVVPPKNKSNTTGELYRFLHRFGLAPDSRVLVTAHNMFTLGNDFAEHDENLEPLYDVTSLHVVAENSLIQDIDPKQLKSNPSAAAMLLAINSLNALNPHRKKSAKWFMCWRDCLKDGLPLGAYGTSDTHAANAIGFVTAGLWVSEFTREAIFDAMIARRSIGQDSRVRSAEMWNTDPALDRIKDIIPLRADVRLFLDDTFMGQKPAVSSPPLLRAFAANPDPSDPVRAVVFIKDGKEVHTAFPASGSGDFSVEWKDSSFTGGSHYYYIRTEFQSGNCAFSSPVFANY